jgi:hypothetical protein
MRTLSLSFLIQTWHPLKYTAQVSAAVNSNNQLAGHQRWVRGIHAAFPPLDRNTRFEVPPGPLPSLATAAACRQAGIGWRVWCTRGSLLINYDYEWGGGKISLKTNNNTSVYIRRIVLCDVQLSNWAQPSLAFISLSIMAICAPHFMHYKTMRGAHVLAGDGLGNIEHLAYTGIYVDWLYDAQNEAN